MPFISNALQRLGIARVAVHMHGHDGNSLVRNGCLYRCRVQIAVNGVYVRKDGGKSIPNE